MPRSVWRGPFFTVFPELAKATASTPIKTTARSCTILPSFVGKKFQIHNGKDYVDLLVTEEMVGHKLGEFAIVRSGNEF